MNLYEQKFINLEDYRIFVQKHIPQNFQIYHASTCCTIGCWYPDQEYDIMYVNNNDHKDKYNPVVYKYTTIKKKKKI